MEKEIKRTVGRPIIGLEKLTRMQFHAGDTQREAWRKAANVAADGNLSLWIRETLDAAAKRVLARL